VVPVGELECQVQGPTKVRLAFTIRARAALPKKSCTRVTVERYRTASGSERDQGATFHAQMPSLPNADSLSRSLLLAVLYRRQLLIDFLGKARQSSVKLSNAPLVNLKLTR
jgi:hypothetical protein